MKKHSVTHDHAAKTAGIPSTALALFLVFAHACVVHASSGQARLDSTGSCQAPSAFRQPTHSILDWSLGFTLNPVFHDFERECGGITLRRWLGTRRAIEASFSLYYDKEEYYSTPPTCRYGGSCTPDGVETVTEASLDLEAAYLQRLFGREALHLYWSAGIAYLREYREVEAYEKGTVSLTHVRSETFEYSFGAVVGLGIDIQLWRFALVAQTGVLFPLAGLRVVPRWRYGVHYRWGGHSGD
ncbi:MAG: hypothetical protein GF331_16705 [Chitinivibrionales bacterium]|nr:hypothetical protein [Chitinivibrionales bacterium]